MEHLHVIDASIMPNITSGNTNGPTQALTLHAAKMFC
ncbi:GMC oxidoreductase [Pseudomonas aestuarii]